MGCNHVKLEGPEIDFDRPGRWAPQFLEPCMWIKQYAHFVGEGQGHFKVKVSYVSENSVWEHEENVLGNKMLTLTV